MKSKPIRKNFHKERIFGLHQNKTDFNYQTEHQVKIREKAYELFERRGKVHGHDWQDWFEAEKIIKREHQTSIKKEDGMPIRRLTRFLDENKVEYRIITHPAAYTSQDTVQAAHESGKEFAKTVMLKVDGQLVMVVLPANHKVDLDYFRQAMEANRLVLATEAEFKNLFPDCETGAMPPFGELYDVDVVIADSFAENEMISFNAGTHREMIKMRYKDFDRLVNPRIVSFIVIAVRI